jgi:hypothetical protein
LKIVIREETLDKGIYGKQGRKRSTENTESTEGLAVFSVFRAFRGQKGFVFGGRLSGMQSVERKIGVNQISFLIRS